MLHYPLARYLIYYLALASAFSGGVFVINNFLTFSLNLPGFFGTLNHLGVNFDVFDVQAPPYSRWALFLGFLQTSSYIWALIYPGFIVSQNRQRPYDAALMSRLSQIIIQAAFWAVMLIGIIDAGISFIRIEEFLPFLVGDELALSLGRPSFRGLYIHLPLIGVGVLIALKRRGIDFIWLACLIVFSEFLIVITRFIFSYEQAFMGDLVRFWYAALFLFASAYTLAHDGHVRVDVLYANFSERAKAYVNVTGSLILGLPLCWIILARGIWNASSPFNLALLNFEVTQQGFGMYVKYLMSGFLLIFAVSMLFQFASLIIRELNVIRLSNAAHYDANMHEKVS